MRQVPDGKIVNNVIELLASNEREKKKNEKKTSENGEKPCEIEVEVDSLANLTPKSRRKELIRRSKEVGIRSSQKKIISRIDTSKLEELKNLQDPSPEKINKILGLINNSGLKKSELKKNVNSFINDPVSRELAMSMVGMDSDTLARTANAITKDPSLMKKVSDSFLSPGSMNSISSLINKKMENESEDKTNETEESDESDNSDEEVEYIVQ